MDKTYMRMLTETICVHHLPIMVLGSGRTTLIDKFATIMYGCFLEAGHEDDALSEYASEVVTLTTDFGVEFNLAFVEPVPIDTLFPWWYSQSVVAGAEPQVNVDDDEFALAPVEASVPSVSLQETIACPGLLHIIHNASEALQEFMVTMEDTVTKLTQVCKLLSHPFTKPRAMETCFSDGVSRCFQADIKKFKAKVHRARWGSVAYAVETVSDFERPLRRFWSLAKYGAEALAVPAAGEDGADDPNASAQLHVADEAISSPIWWARVLTLKLVFKVILKCFTWVEGCSCHTHLDMNAVTSQVRDRWLQCPMRGQRLPEVAAGDFFTMFQVSTLEFSQLVPRASPII